MQKWKPLIASLAMIALALGGMAVWKFAGGKPSKGKGNSANTPGHNGGTRTGSDGVEWVSTELEDLQPLDPLGLWPRDGQRIASAEFNVMWETSEHADCRLLVSTNRQTWYAMGHTGGTRHFLPVNFGDFESTLSFAVEFDDRGKRYRSKARTVSFGNGARFERMEHRFTIRGDGQQQFEVAIDGRDPTGLPQSAYLWGWLDEDVSPGVVPGKSTQGGGTILVVLMTTDSIENSAHGWLELYDAAANTYDRTLIYLGR